MAWKILFALLYDFLLLLAVWFFAAIPVVMWQGGSLEDKPFATLALQIYLLGITYLYLSYFWTQSGQTPGLRTWKLQLQREDGYLLTRHNANVRFLWAVLFFGITLFGLITRKKQLLHDQISKTRIVPIAD
ncbi:RDD family protein [Thiomicrorhabdus indica]|uniref:RDD family protein n=1 Tax=Thiomicrorhabdus indica TaxID=2267253 RepID=UPI00102E02A5|nr:RDD family protein [Thiomicrorhabdus indica]